MSKAILVMDMPKTVLIADFKKWDFVKQYIASGR